MRICCVCTGNTCRSPMLAALLRHALNERGLDNIGVESAGVAAGGGSPASPEAIACMQGDGLDITEHRSRHIDQVELAAIDRFVCLGPAHAEALQHMGVSPERITVLLTDRGGVPDPIGGSEEVYRRCADVLAHEARSLADDIKIAAETDG